MKKLKAVLMPLLLIAAVLTLTGTVFYFGIHHYVENRIAAEMGLQLEKLETGELPTYQPMLYYSFDDDPNRKIYISINADGVINENHLFPVTMLSVNNTGQPDPTEINTEYTHIIDYCRSHQEMYRETTCRQIVSDEKEYYVMARKREYDGAAHTVILVASPDQLFDFLGTVNLIFTAVMLALGIVLFFCSYRIGRAVERSKEKLTRYFQNASHELKTPIMSIQGYAEGLETGVVQDVPKAARIILSESDRMNTLVGDILFLSKVDAGHSDRTWERIELGGLLCDILCGIREQALQNGIQTSVVGTEQPHYVMGNEAQLETALGNILSNALRFAKETIRVQITPEKKQIRVDIINDGEAIPEKDLPHIFERFYKGVNGGHGIGLAITREVIKAHKGKIEVHNENGVCFSIWLKRAK